MFFFCYSLYLLMSCANTHLFLLQSHHLLWFADFPSLLFHFGKVASSIYPYYYLSIRTFAGIPSLLFYNIHPKIIIIIIFTFSVIKTRPIKSLYRQVSFARADRVYQNLVQKSLFVRQKLIH